jgi:UDP-glucose 4-epimerase
VTILVTGATGFVMASVVRELAARGHAVVGADRVPPDAAVRAFVPATVRFAPLDVTDAAAVRALVDDVRPERAVLGAAITAIPLGVERARFRATVDVNVGGTLTVLEALHAAGGGRALVVSSGSVYGPRPDLAPITEDDPARPAGVYGLTKWAGEALAARFAEVHDVDLVVARLASPFGPLERDTGSRPLLSPIRDWAHAAARGAPVRVLGPLDFARDVISVEDVGAALATLLLAPRPSHRAYHVGWGRLTPAREVVAALERLVPGLEVEVDEAAVSPWQAGVRGPLVTTRLREDLGWTPRHDLERGLAAYLDWIRRTP